MRMRTNDSMRVKFRLVIDAFEFLTQKIDELKETSPKPAPPLTQPEVAEPEVDLSQYAPIAPRPGTFLSHVQSQFAQQTPSQISSSIQTQIPSQITVPSQSQIPVSAETPESSNFSHGDTIPLSIQKAQNEYQLQYRIDLPQASSIQTEIPQTTQSLQNQGILSFAQFILRYICLLFAFVQKIKKS